MQTTEASISDAQQSQKTWGVPTQESAVQGQDLDNEDMCTSPTQESSSSELSNVATITSHQFVPCVGLSTSADSDRLHVYQNLMTYSILSPMKASEKEEITHYDIGPFAGYALLICNDRIPGDQSHLSVDIDIGLMSTALQSCEWNVEKFLPNSPCTYMTQSQCKELISSLVCKDYSKYSGFIVYYSGHGNCNGLLLQDGGCIPYAYIVREFSSINSLARKPKIFIFDSCRTLIAYPPKKKFLNFSELIQKSHAENEIQRDYPPADTLICYSTNDGMPGWSHDDRGSFYTQELAKKIVVLWKRLSFTEIVTLAHGWTTQLAQQYEKQQQPVMYNALSRLLLLGGKCFY